MNRRAGFQGCLVWVAAFVLGSAGLRAQTLRVATYNLENYLDQPTETRPRAKSPQARAKVRQSICALKPDVLALQEIGGASALLELRRSLKADGLDFPYWEHVGGFDTNVHVAVLSRFPFTARRPHLHESFLLGRRRFQVSRGIAEVRIRVNPNYSFTLLSAHLKSKRTVPQADEAEQRLEEAKILRRIVQDALSANPNANIVLAGDFNDTQDSPTLKTLLGRGRLKLTDTRPAERNGDSAANPPFAPRRVTWTQYYGKEDSYRRIDYILLSPGMAREWRPDETYILTLPDWGLGSDHRPLVATFTARDE
jgi:endonuclease/exonuclease/phosphatase family metal-dependent hydrolase